MRKEKKKKKQLPEWHCRPLLRPVPTHPAHPAQRSFSERQLSLPKPTGNQQLWTERSATKFGSCWKLNCLIFCDCSKLYTSLFFHAQRWWLMKNTGASAITAPPGTRHKGTGWNGDRTEAGAAWQVTSLTGLRSSLTTFHILTAQKGTNKWRKPSSILLTPTRQIWIAYNPEKLLSF